MPMKIELLAPAPTADAGIVAINAGADAVYVGPPRFGARVRAGNSLESIARLAQHAHLFGARVYATLNTLLYDEEIPSAQSLAWELYRCGVDALIVQDMAWARMHLPPMPLHASTQTDNRSVAKVQFLERCGFPRAILARELSIAQIRAIRAHTALELEAFVHGALCVSYSGQCYLSLHLGRSGGGRSANRGACAQPCRLPYTLSTPSGQIIARDRHFLSLRDLNQTPNLEALLEAGVSSLKIEGRLKDEAYVQNITAHYRRELDDILARHLEWTRASQGICSRGFTPNPQLSFARQQGQHFAQGRTAQMASLDSPKSVGQPLGRVTRKQANWFELDTQVPLQNGDGLCLLREGRMLGFRANRVEGRRVYSLQPVEGLQVGDLLYRNASMLFAREMEQSPCQRSLSLQLALEEGAEQSWQLLVEGGGAPRLCFPIEGRLLPAKNPDRQLATWEAQLAKTGDPRLRVDRVRLDGGYVPFMPIGQINALRRDALRQFLEQYPAPDRAPSPITPTPYPSALPRDYRLNITNRLSRDFYALCGLEGLESAPELQPREGIELMRTKYCVRYELGLCPRQKPGAEATPLLLQNSNASLRLEFDCSACEMVVLGH